MDQKPMPVALGELKIALTGAARYFRSACVPTTCRAGSANPSAAEREAPRVSAGAAYISDTHWSYRTKAETSRSSGLRSNSCDNLPLRNEHVATTLWFTMLLENLNVERTKEFAEFFE